MRPSMGSVGDAYDYTMCVSFFATLEFRLLELHRFREFGAAGDPRARAGRREPEGDLIADRPDGNCGASRGPRRAYRSSLGTIFPASGADPANREVQRSLQDVGKDMAGHTPSGPLNFATASRESHRQPS